jgi:NADH-quinone oxidoreductase subunit D
MSVTTTVLDDPATSARAGHPHRAGGQPHHQFRPAASAAHGVLRLILEMKGESVERADPHIGLLHRGTEKFIEYKTYLQANPYFDRLDYVSPMCMEHSFILAQEKLLGIQDQVPERAKWIRTMFAEITRVLNHLLNATTYALDCGAITPALWGFEQREHLLEMYEMVSGSHYHANYFRAGGVHRDLPAELPAKIQRWAAQFPKFLDELEGLLTENRIFKQRTVDIGVMTAEQAMAWGFSGPCLRASGVAWDLRKSQPYDMYAELDFDVPVGPQRRLLRPLPRPHAGDAAVAAHHPAMPGADAGRAGSHPGQQDHAAQARRDEALDGVAHPSLQALHRGLSRAGRRNLHRDRGAQGRVRRVSGGRRAPTSPIAARSARPASRILQAIEALSKGHMLADAVAIIGSLDIVFGEIDR